MVRFSEARPLRMFSKGGLISEIADLNFVAVHAPCWRALARKANPFPAGLSEPGSVCVFRWRCGWMVGCNVGHSWAEERQQAAAKSGSRVVA